MSKPWRVVAGACSLLCGAQGKLAAAIALFVATRQAVLMPFQLTGLAKVIDSAKEFEYTHGGAPLSTTF